VPDPRKWFLVAVEPNFRGSFLRGDRIVREMPQPRFPSTPINVFVNNQLLRHLEKAALIAGVPLTQFAREVLEAEAASRILPTVRCDENYSRSKKT
jgi:hypothetical protein